MMHQDRVVMRRGLSVAFLLLLCSITVSGLGSVVRSHHRYIEKFNTWEKAQEFCKHHYTDLATIYSESDASSLNMKGYHAWIGLHKDKSILQHGWVWSDGEEHTFPSWSQNQPHYNEECAVLSYNKKLYGKSCSGYCFFFCHKIEGTSTSYTFFNESKTWAEAKEYCNADGQYLAGIGKEDLGTALGEKDFPVWIGKHKNGDTWKWSTGMSDYTNWKTGMPDNSGDCVSISSLNKKMATQNCSDRLPFLCFLENVILVKENKTWEEALEYCRGLLSPASRYDLLSVQPGDEQYVMNKVLAASTEEVWTGLRFLAGEWLWMNGADILYDLPLCPVYGHHCGAMSKSDTGSVEPRDCSEKKNFLCYS
ncbi:C-type mannose receptor 2-like [Cololabis saira]|uniref:C-type mannose receptor 2-like n=1 Tax=Cololabis saira TaxID=129043 RepID=UPI002AD2A3F6|nr:C-type mannose receptor 2-like [Cololabis saira]